MLVSVVQQSDSVIHTHTHIYILFQFPFDYSLLQDIEYSSLGYTAGSCCLSILYIYIYIYLCIPVTPKFLTYHSIFFNKLTFSSLSIFPSTDFFRQMSVMWWVTNAHSNHVQQAWALAQNYTSEMTPNGQRQAGGLGVVSICLFAPSVFPQHLLCFHMLNI